MKGGSVYKRCPCGTTGTPGRPACRRTHGAWWWRAEAARDPETGRRRQPAGGGYATRQEAAEGLVEFLGRRAAGTWRDDQGLTVGGWFDRWLAEGNWEQLTRATYEGHIRTVWRPRIGRIRLRDLAKHHIEAALRDVALTPSGEPKAGRTLRSYRATLRASLAAAIDADLLSANPAAGTMRAIPTVRRAELQLWQPAELSLFLAVTTADTLAPMWRVAAFTGLRRAELCGLRWIDVDLAAEHPGITVRQTVNALAGQQACLLCGGKHTGAFIKPIPKSEAGRRWVPLVAEAVAALELQRARQDEQGAAWGEAYVPHDLVFAREDGTPLNPSSVTQRFKALVAGVRHPVDPSFRLPQIRPHDMRHGAASLMIAAGVPIETVSLILGHSSPAVTRQIYTHVLRGPAAAAVEAAAGLVRANGAQFVHSEAPSSDRREASTTDQSRSEALDTAEDPELHCITNPDPSLMDADGDCRSSE